MSVFRLLILALAAVAVIGCSTPDSSAQAPDGWATVQGDVGTTYRAESGATVHVLPLLEADRVTGYDISELGDDYAEEVIDYALSAFEISVAETEGDDFADPARPMIWGTGETPDGARRIAAMLDGEGQDRRLVALVADADDYAAVGGRGVLENDFPAGAGATAAAEPSGSAAASSSPPAGTYPAPSSEQETFQWPRENDWYVQRPGDATSPRVSAATLDPGDADSASEALQQAVDYFGVRSIGDLSLERLDAWAGWSREIDVALLPTEYGGQPGILFALVAKDSGSDVYRTQFLEVPRSTYVEWGGVARVLLLRGVIPSMDSFPDEVRSEIAQSSLESQIDLYEAALDKQYKELAVGLMASQAQTLLRMQELNYDLLLGGDITSPFIAD